MDPRLNSMKSSKVHKPQRPKHRCSNHDVFDPHDVYFAGPVVFSVARLDPVVVIALEPATRINESSLVVRRHTKHMMYIDLSRDLYLRNYIPGPSKVPQKMGHDP